MPGRALFSLPSADLLLARGSSRAPTRKCRAIVLVRRTMTKNDGKRGCLATPRGKAVPAAFRDISRDRARSAFYSTRIIRSRQISAQNERRCSQSRIPRKGPFSRWKTLRGRASSESRRDFADAFAAKTGNRPRKQPDLPSFMLREPSPANRPDKVRDAIT